MLSEAKTTDYTKLLSTEAGLRAVTRWFLQRDILTQFSLARITDCAKPRRRGRTHSAQRSSSGTTAARATTSTGTDTSRRRAPATSDVLSARKVTVGTNARTRTARSARRAATDLRSSVGPASCIRSTTDMLDNIRLGRGGNSAVVPWMSIRMVVCRQPRLM
jgi:hypothetical protein